MTDVLGPAAAGAPRAIASSDPSITATIQFPDAADTWFQDCVNNTAGTGTPYVAEWANRQLQQIRRVVRNSGVSLTYADDQLGYAIQQGLQWVGSFGGTANALLATMVPAQPTLVAGTEIKGLITATNTGSATLNVNGLGALPIALPDGTPLTGAEMVIGGVASLIYTGSGYVLLAQSLLGFQRILAVNTTFFVNNSSGNDANTGLTSGTAWATVAHALKVLATFNLNGNIVTLKLALTGIDYAMPTNFVAPSNGQLVILGDTAAQASYTLAGAPAANLGVVDATGGSVALRGLTVKYTGGGGSGLVGNSCSISLQNVTFATTVVGANALILSSTGCVCTIGAGCFLNGSAGAALEFANGGVIQQGAIVGISGSPSFTAFALGTNAGVFTVTTTGLSFSGTCSGQRFNLANAAGANTNGAGVNYFPGSSAGVVTSPAYYS